MKHVIPSVAFACFTPMDAPYSMEARTAPSACLAFLVLGAVSFFGSLTCPSEDAHKSLTE